MPFPNHKPIRQPTMNYITAVLILFAVQTASLGNRPCSESPLATTLAPRSRVQGQGEPSPSLSRHRRGAVEDYKEDYEEDDYDSMPEDYYKKAEVKETGLTGVLQDFAEVGDALLRAKEQMDSMQSLFPTSTPRPKKSKKRNRSHKRPTGNRKRTKHRRTRIMGTRIGFQMRPRFTKLRVPKIRFPRFG